MAIFKPKPLVNLFGKVSIFGLFEVLVFIAQKRVFFDLEYRKKQFPGLYCLEGKVGKMAIFRPKPLVNPFGKVSIFRLFELFVFIAQKVVFFAVEYRKRHFPGLYCIKRKVGKMAIFNQNHGLTRLEKCQFFDFSNFLFLQPRKAFFRSRIS